MKPVCETCCSCVCLLWRCLKSKFFSLHVGDTSTFCEPICVEMLHIYYPFQLSCVGATITLTKAADKLPSFGQTSVLINQSKSKNFSSAAFNPLVFWQGLQNKRVSTFSYLLCFYLVHLLEMLLPSENALLDFFCLYFSCKTVQTNPTLSFLSLKINCSRVHNSNSVDDPQQCRFVFKSSVSQLSLDSTQRFMNTADSIIHCDARDCNEIVMNLCLVNMSFPYRYWHSLRSFEPGKNKTN